jgi:hypothetical protein
MQKKILSSAGTAISRVVCGEQKVCLSKLYLEYELPIKRASDMKYLLASIIFYLLNYGNNPSSCY